MTKKARLKKLLMNIFLLGMAGLLYGIFVSYTGLAIPCLFRKVTGLLCPGCGVTGMCVALLHLDWRGAFSCHPVLFVLLLPLTAVFILSTVIFRMWVFFIYRTCHGRFSIKIETEEFPKFLRLRFLYYAKY